MNQQQTSSRPRGSEHQYLTVNGQTYCVTTLRRMHLNGTLTPRHPAWELVTGMTRAPLCA